MAAGALGTNALLAQCKHSGSLPRISDQLGELVRTNSEALLAVTLPDDRLNPSNDVAISGSIHPRHDTHIEFVTYGPKGDFMSSIFTLLTGDGSRVTRPLRLLGNILSHPVRFAKVLWPFGWGRRTVIVGVMQSLDNAIAFRAKPRWFGGVRLATAQNREKPNPTFIPLANEAAAWLAEHTGGIAQSGLLEALANIPTTAHILGGAVIGRDAGSGVVDSRNRVFGYQNLLVCDGAVMPGNPGVNPSLTIAAIAENAMSHIPPGDKV
jgi:cholesterol oxidase